MSTTQSSIDLAELSKPHLSPVLGRYFERGWSHGEGHRLFDTEGRAYLDFACGIATTSLGHGHPAVTAAIHAQVDRLVHVSNGLGYIEPVARLAAAIAETLPDPLDTVFFGNSGAEAIEGALKLARRVSGRPGLVAFSGGFHGRTFGAASVTTSNPNFRAGYEPLLPSVYVAPFPNVYREFEGDEARATSACLERLQRLFVEQIPASSVAALLIEPILGEGGYYPAPAGFLRGLRLICDEQGILLIVDEVQTGYGRTGRMWAFEHAGVVPDVVCLAKSIANGLPLGAIVSRRELQDRWGKGSHGSTFGGNLVACAAGLAVLETIEREGLVENARRQGARLEAGLRRIASDASRIGDVRGLGLMLAVEFVTDRATRAPAGELADAVIARCADDGLIVLTCGASHQVVRWIPPLDVTEAEVDEALEIFAGVVRDLAV